MPIADECMTYIENNQTQNENDNIINIINGVIQLCETLEKLHNKNISHRDIKPSNIYFYDGRYSFSDFGLVGISEGTQHFTRSDKGLGAIFTIAPEMKRNPKKADGKKADVFSLAKTMWMFLSSDEKGFDGVYNYLDRSHSLSYINKYRHTHLVEIHELLKAATDNDPNNRPSIKQFKETLIEWLNIFGDPQKSQISDWLFLEKQLFGTYPPKTAIWDNCEQIVDILNIIGTTPAFNHMLLSSNGGEDFKFAKLSNEESCIELYDDLLCRIIKPKRLIYEGFDNNCEWNYFLLELDELKPILSDNAFGIEKLVEDSPAHYVSASAAQYGVYDYDSGKKLPDGYKEVYRHTKGKLLFVMKFGPYNHISATYDGRHGSCESFDFRKHIEDLIELYAKIYDEAKKIKELSDLNEIELMHKILSLDVFQNNPYEKQNDDMYDKDKVKRVYSDKKLSKEYLKEKHASICFKDLFPQEAIESDNETIIFYFAYNNPGSSSFSFLLDKGEYIAVDGYIKHFDAPSSEKCFHISNRNMATELVKGFNNHIRCFLEQNNLKPLEDYQNPVSIESRRIGKPTHLFKRSEIEELMRNADDRVDNQMVIDENGYAKIIGRYDNGHLYPVRIETWDSGNNYVGKYSDLTTLDDVYMMLLEGWYCYLCSNKNVYMDHYVDANDEKTLIEKIKSFY